MPTRFGGFGGIEGLVAWLRRERIRCVIDATHPFAEQISRHAAIACEVAGCALVAFERPPWKPVAGDRWHCVESLEAAVAALPEARATVFLAIGRQHLPAFAARPAHRYLVRTVDPLDEPLPLPDAITVVDRGPFGVEADRALLAAHEVELVVARNAGGSGAYAKLEAARALDLPVLLIDRPIRPARSTFDALDSVVAAVHRHVDHRGVYSQRPA